MFASFAREQAAVRDPDYCDTFVVCPTPAIDRYMSTPTVDTGQIHINISAAPQLWCLLRVHGMIYAGLAQCRRQWILNPLMHGKLLVAGT